MPTQTNTALSSGRRKRAIPEGTATPEAIASFTLKGSFPLHKTTQPGILALALHPTEVSCTGCAFSRDGGFCTEVVVFTHTSNKRQQESFGNDSCRTTGCVGSCVQVEFLNSRVLIACSQSSVYVGVLTFPGVCAPLAALLCVMLQSNLLATCGADATVQLFDLANQRQVTSLTGVCVTGL